MTTTTPGTRCTTNHTIAMQQRKNRPPDTNFAQQRLRTRPARFSNIHLAIILVVVGIIFLPVGTKLLSISDNVYEQKVEYDGGSSSNCSISASDEGKKCQVTFDIDSNVDGPFYVYYQLENFFQNHRRYYQSKSIMQLQGQNLVQNSVSLECNPLYLNGTILLNPCGLIANSYFNDVFTLNAAASSPAGLTLDESDIALPADKNHLYKQVDGFLSEPVSDAQITCEEVGMPSDCSSYTDSSGQMYLYWYPDNDTVQYLYESYPNQISPIEGVTDQHFMVWMRTEALPTFRKLYGVVDSGFSNGDKLVIDVTANYEVDSFGGKKSLVISNLGRFGGKNAFPGQVFITLGAFSLVFGLFMVGKEFYHP